MYIENDVRRLGQITTERFEAGINQIKTITQEPESLIYTRVEKIEATVVIVETCFDVIEACFNTTKALLHSLSKVMDGTHDISECQIGFAHRIL